MTDPKPTEIELTGKKKKKESVSKRKIVAIISGTIFVVAIIVLTIVMANHASKMPELIQSTSLGTLP